MAFGLCFHNEKKKSNAEGTDLNYLLWLPEREIRVWHKLNSRHSNLENLRGV